MKTETLVTLMKLLETEKETKKDDEENGKYVIVRTYSAGVFAGVLENRSGREVTLTNARRLWRWEGAASLSQLAMEGVSKPSECKFPCEVSEVLLLEAVEILNTTEKAKQSIKSVPVWQE